MSNLFERLPVSLPEELTEILAENENVRIERIVSTGQCSPDDFWYDQSEDEWVAVLTGYAELVFADGEHREMRPGDHMYISAHRRHRIEATAPDQPTVWLAVFFPAMSSRRPVA